MELVQNEKEKSDYNSALEKTIRIKKKNHIATKVTNYLHIFSKIVKR